MFLLIVRRLLLAIPVMLILTLLLFLALKLIPGDVALVMAGERATPERVEFVRNAMHLNDPWVFQYFGYLKRLIFDFDLGESLFHEQKISILLKSAIPATLELGGYAMVIAVPVGITLGVLGAVFRNKAIDKVTSLVSLGGISIPIFWLALMMMYVFSIQLGWLPTSGRLSDDVLFDGSVDSWINVYSIDGLILGLRGQGWDVFKSAIQHLLLPAIALSTIPMAHISRMTRAAFLEVLSQDYIRTARAKGMSVLPVIMKHAFRNAALQIVTITMLQAGTIFGGAVITETMFAWPGMGKMLVESIASRDIPMVQSGTLVVGFIFVFCNLMADVVCGFLDPRVVQ